MDPAARQVARRLVPPTLGGAPRPAVATGDPPGAAAVAGPVRGDVVPDYGGPRETFETALVAPPRHLVYRSRRGRTELSWAITLTRTASGTRVHLRLRLAPVRRVWLAESMGELFDALTVAGMAAGLRERLAETRP